MRNKYVMIDKCSNTKNVMYMGPMQLTVAKTSFISTKQNAYDGRLSSSVRLDTQTQNEKKSKLHKNFFFSWGQFKPKITQTCGQTKCRHGKSTESDGHMEVRHRMTLRMAETRSVSASDHWLHGRWLKSTQGGKLKGKYGNVQTKSNMISEGAKVMLRTFKKREYMFTDCEDWIHKQVDFFNDYAENFPPKRGKNHDEIRIQTWKW